MRALLLLAAAVSLAGCGNNDQSDNTQNVDENLSAENIVSNDVTAIDAVTGDAANMAAETPVADLNELNAVAPENNPGAPPSVKPAPKTTTPPAKPQTDTAANAATSNEQ